MPWILYPDTRFVTDEQIVSWAHDAMVNDELAAESRRRGDAGVPDDYWPNIARPSYQDARAYLDDRGDVTFASDDADPAMLRERAQTERLLRD